MIRKDIYNDNTVKEDIKESRKQLASEPDEFEVIELPILLQQYEKELEKNPDLKFRDFYYGKKTERKELKDGGVTGDTLVEGYGDLIDAWVRKIDLADPDESLTEYINRVRKSEAKSNE